MEKLSFIGPYQLLQPLGQGGMASVHKAERVGEDGISRLFAIKLVHEHLLQDSTFLERFKDEARLASYLYHRNIVQMMEFGKDAISGSFFLVMEHVDGWNLSSLMAEIKAKASIFPPDFILLIMREVCHGLNYAHHAIDNSGTPLQMIHRDLKPSNILISKAGDVKIADFGIARAESNLAQTMETGGVRGTVHYMSPEQAKGQKNIDHRSDIFSLGAIIYQMFSGQHLYTGDNLFAILNQAQYANVANQLNELKLNLKQNSNTASFAEPLVSIIKKSLSYNPNERFNSAEDMGDLFLEVQEHISNKKSSIESWLQAIGLISRPTGTIFVQQNTKASSVSGPLNKKDNNSLQKENNQTYDINNAVLKDPLPPTITENLNDNYGTKNKVNLNETVFSTLPTDPKEINLKKDKRDISIKISEEDNIDALLTQKELDKKPTSNKPLILLLSFVAVLVAIAVIFSINNLKKGSSADKENNFAKTISNTNSNPTDKKENIYQQINPTITPEAKSNLPAEEAKEIAKIEVVTNELAKLPANTTSNQKENTNIDNGKNTQNLDSLTAKNTLKQNNSNDVINKNLIKQPTTRQTPEQTSQPKAQQKILPKAMAVENLYLQPKKNNQTPDKKAKSEDGLNLETKSTVKPVVFCATADVLSTISIDSKNVAETPLNYYAMIAGKHKIQFTIEGGIRLSTNINTNSGESWKCTANFESNSLSCAKDESICN